MRRRQIVVWVGQRHRAERAGDHDREGRRHPDRHLPGGAKDGVDEQGQQTGVETMLRRQPGERGIGHALGDGERGDGQTGQHIGSEPARAVVGPEPANDRQDVAQQVVVLTVHDFLPCASTRRMGHGARPTVVAASAEGCIRRGLWCGGGLKISRFPRRGARHRRRGRFGRTGAARLVASTDDGQIWSS